MTPQAWLMVSMAAAQPNPVDWLADAQTLTLGDDVVSINNLDVESGPGRLQIPRSLGRLIISGAAAGGAPARVVGAVVAGPGELHLDVEDPATAQALANRLVGWMHGPRERGDALVAGHGLTVQARTALVLSADLTIAHTASTTPAPEKLHDALGAVFDQRVALTPAELAPGRTVGWDRYLVEELGASTTQSRHWLDARTDQPWGALEPERARRDPVPGDGWLAVIDDPTASLDGHTRAVAYTAGIDTLGRPGRLPLMTLTTRTTTPAERLTTTGATGTVAVQHAGDDGLDVQVRLELVLRANDTVRAVVLRLPAVGKEFSWDPPAQPDLTWLELGQTGRSRWVAAVPVVPLQPGEERTLPVAWGDQWPMRGQPASTGLQRILPGLVPDRMGSPSAFDISFDIPDGLTIAASGQTVPGEQLRTRQVTPAAWPRVAIGRWNASLDDPALRLTTTATLAPELTAEITPLIQALTALLQTSPPTELDVVQVPPGLRSGETGGGMVAVHQPILRDLATRRGRPNARSVLAHELAHLTWGHAARPETISDRWIAEVFAEVSADLVIGETNGPAALQARLARHRRVAITLDPQPLTAAWGGSDARGALYHMGPAVLLGPLRSRIGDAAFRRAMVALAAQPKVTTRSVQAAMEQASNEDLDTFFATWIHGGQVPTVSARWVADRNGHNGVSVTANITCDLPYGTVEVPVALVNRRGRVLAERTVAVVDGQATVTIGPVQDSRVDLVLDPHGESVLRQGLWARGR